MHLDENVSIHLRMRELIKNQSKLLFFAGPPMVLGYRKKESALWAYFSSKNRSDRKIKLCWKCWRPGKYHCLTYKTIQAFKTWRSVCGYSEKNCKCFHLLSAIYLSPKYGWNLEMALLHSNWDCSARVCSLVIWVVIFFYNQDSTELQRRVTYLLG